MITELETRLVNIYVARNLELYKKFMGIHEMPDFNIVLMEIHLKRQSKRVMVFQLLIFMMLVKTNTY
ncbi:hypothetical protein [Bacillus sp. 1P02SD]|uniref:hypothetical protein n=1 Tax=Bacillus sp. 1P02SD TaxID=3132264 RepID=UPI0039A22A3B